MLTGEIKKILIKILQKFVADHQEARKKITMEIIEQFLSTHPRKYVQKWCWDAIYLSWLQILNAILLALYLFHQDIMSFQNQVSEDGYQVC